MSAIVWSALTAFTLLVISQYVEVVVQALQLNKRKRFIQMSSQIITNELSVLLELVVQNMGNAQEHDDVCYIRSGLNYESANIIYD